ncbi:MAG: hypothetical protein RLZZ37_510 [Actinomycetota bacterium]|jgi:glycosyltransferase involved in cell wall biosynthesis
MAKSICCIIPIKNGTRYLEECLDSINQQTIKVDKIYLVDDHSTDNLKYFIKQFDLNLIYLKSPGNGLAAALNHGIGMAKTELISFLDSDDVWTKDHIYKLTKPYERNTKLDMVYGRVTNVDENLNELGKSEVTRLLSSSIFHKRVFDRIELFDESLEHGANIDFIVRLFAKGLNYLAIEDVVLLRRIHGNNMGHDKITAKKSLIKLIRKHKENIEIN